VNDDPEFDAWARTVPLDLTADPIWRTPAYRLSLWAMSLAQRDAQPILRHPLTRVHLDQLLRSVGAISANLDEGYSRSSGKERAHFYEYALGSAREARSWYYKCATAFAPDVLASRLACLSRIIRILTVVIPRERAGKGLLARRTPGTAV
jgi:four helix bundle protein